MFTAYIDDSGRASGPTYVLAGFLASVEGWGDFASFWKGILDTPPKLDYFKMKDAMYPRISEKHGSRYFGWPREQIGETVDLLTEVIWRKLPLRIRITVPNLEWERIFKGKVGPHADFPFMLAHISAMQETTRLPVWCPINNFMPDDDFPQH
ncbi:MAG: hypothetical protein ACREQI_12590 [Candidatus Binataceae bacterium]